MLVRQKNLAMETHLSVCHSKVQWIFSSFHFNSWLRIRFISFFGSLQTYFY